MPTARELNLPYLRILLAVNLGAAALFAGDTEAPRHAFNEVLTLSREVVVPAFSVGGFLGLAGLAALEGEMERAARLAGVAAAQRREPTADAVDRRLEITFLEPARAQHGEEAWDAMAREGATLSFEDAIAYALQEDGEDVRTHREAMT